MKFAVKVMTTESAITTIGGGLSSNPYFSAGFGLLGVTAGLALLRQGAIHGVTLARRHFLVTLEIPSKDAAYPWVLAWLSTQREGAMHSSSGGKTKGLLQLGRMGMSHQLSVETTYAKRDDGSAVASFVLAPGPGSHYFRYKRAWFKVMMHYWLQLQTTTNFCASR